MPDLQLLEHLALGLLDADDPDISPQDHRHHAHGPNRRPRNQHHLLRICVGVLNRDPSGRAHRIRHLRRDVPVDGEQIREFGSGEGFGELGREDTLPDGGRDRQADRAPDVAEQAQYRQHDRDVLVGSGRHDGDLVADDDRAGGERDEDLAHDYVADVLVRRAEIDHEAQPQDAQGDTKVEADGLEASGIVYEQAHGEGAYDGANGVGLDDIAGIADAQVVHYLQERAEVAGPAVVADEERGRKNASAKDCPIQ